MESCFDGTWLVQRWTWSPTSWRKFAPFYNKSVVHVTFAPHLFVHPSPNLLSTSLYAPLLPPEITIFTRDDPHLHLRHRRAPPPPQSRRSPCKRIVFQTEQKASNLGANGVKMKARPACEWSVSGFSALVCRKVGRRRFFPRCNVKTKKKETGLKQMRQRAAHVAVSESNVKGGVGCICNSKLRVQVGF